MSRYPQMSGDENECYHDSEKTLPKTTVQRVITENLPPGFSTDKEVGILMSECGTEFVRMITSVGYEIAEKEGMSTIAPRHVVAALIELGYGEFVDEVQALVGQLKDSEKLKKHVKKQKSVSRSSLSQEELLKQQEELFRAARAKFQLDQGRGDGAISEAVST